MTKDCAVEATAIAARMFPKRLAERLDDQQIARARSWLDQVSVVAECRAAVRIGVRDRGVSAMHDATEGGLAGGLVEMARATGHDLRVSAEKVLLSPEATAACAAFGIDPLWTLSEGTLILTVRPRWALQVMEAIAEEGVAVQEIGEVMRGSGTLWLTGTDGKVEKIAEPRPDPYWEAYARALREGWT
jgi:hydrogenase maturation factor